MHLSITLAAVSAARRAAAGSSPAAIMSHRVSAAIVAAAVRRGHRQLPERLHLPAAARPLDRLARVGVPCVRPLALVVRKYSGPQLRAACAGAAAPAARRSRSAIRSSSCMTALHVRRGLVVLWPGLAARLAPGLRLRADRAVRDRSRASPAAERHHAARHRRSAWRSASSPSRAGSRRSSASSSAAAAVGDCRGLLPRPRTKKASGWAT